MVVKTGIRHVPFPRKAYSLVCVGGEMNCTEIIKIKCERELRER